MGYWYIKVCQIFTSSRNDIKLQGAHNPLWINYLIIHISLYYFTQNLLENVTQIL